MTTYTITLSQAENYALSYVALDQQEWIDNAIRARCRIGIDEIVNITIQKCLDNNIQIPGSKDEMVLLAYEQGWVKTARERQESVDNLSMNQQ